MTAQFSDTICYIGMTGLDVLRVKAGRGPVLHGVAVSLHPRFHQPYYQAMGLYLSFSGGLLVAGDRITDPAIDSQSLGFKRIVRMAFGDGILLHALDVSTDARGGRKPLPG